jgi:hypothetical protein
VQRYPTDLTDTEWTILAPLIWRCAGVWERMYAPLRGDLRAASGRTREPSAGIGGVSNVDMDGNNTLQIKAIRVVISTFETLPKPDRRFSAHH